MALFLSSPDNGVVALRAVSELTERLRQDIATAQGREAEVEEFLQQLAAGFAAEAASEREFQLRLARVRTAIGAADQAALPALLREGRNVVAEHNRRRRAPLLVMNALSELEELVVNRLLGLLLATNSGEWALLLGNGLGRREVTFRSGVSGWYVGADGESVVVALGASLAAAGMPVDVRPLVGGLQWSATLDGWQDQVAVLTARGDERCMTLADLRVVAGEEGFAAEVQAVLRSALARWRQSATFQQAARQASGLRLALGFFGGLKVERSGPHRGAINLDAQALTPLLANVRTLAIAHAIPETGTVERLRGVVAKGGLNVEPANRVLEAYQQLQRWKIETELGDEEGRSLECYVWPERMTSDEQEAFKDCLDAVAALERLVVQNLVGMS